MIKFKDLSLPLKIGFVGGILYCLFVGIGFIIGMIDTLMGLA